MATRHDSGRRTGKAGQRAVDVESLNRRPVRPDLAVGAPLDDLSQKIIEQLQVDGRRPYTTIGRTVGLSEAAVRQRVQRLLDSGIMQIVAVTDPLRMGFPRRATVGIRTSGSLEEISDELARLTEVQRVVITAGSFDLLTEIICRDDDHLLELLQRFRAMDGVAYTEAFVYLRATQR